MFWICSVSSWRESLWGIQICEIKKTKRSNARPHRSDLKIPRNSMIFIFMDVNTQMITNHPHISFLIPYICTDTINLYQCITWNEKNHQKIPLHVTLLRHTTLHMKIHLYALAHKSPPRNPAIWLLLNFLYANIINTQRIKPAIWILLHFLHAYIISTQTPFVPYFT